jgi:hypothetical protein
MAVLPLGGRRLLQPATPTHGVIQGQGKSMPWPGGSLARR